MTFLLLEIRIITLKQIIIKLELETDVACFSYIGGKKKTKENKKTNTIQRILKIIDWMERSSFIFNKRETMMVNEYKNIVEVRK